MEASEALRGYAHLLALARRAAADGMGLEGSVEAAVDRCIAEGVLADYLVPHRAEAIDMLFTIEDEERAMRVHWEAVAREATEEGMARGLAKGLAKGLAEGAESTMLSCLRSIMTTTGADAEGALDMLQVPVGERAKYRALLADA